LDFIDLIRRIVNAICVLITFLSALGFAIDTQCSEIDISDGTPGNEFNVCWLENLNITERGVQITSPSSLNYINGLCMWETTVNFMPQFDKVLAKNMKMLVILGCHLKQVERNDVAQFPELKEIALPQNDLQTLPEDLFMNNLKLETISMYNNKFIMIGLEILTPLSSLKIAEFRNAV
jgi:hypothetical protein